MPVKSYTMGPGVFTIGEVATPLDLSAQLKSCKLTPKVNAEDPTEVLSGEQLAGERTYAWTVNGTVIQDLSDGGLADYALTHAGEEVPWTFTPSTAVGSSWSGQLILDPIEIGGDAKTKPTSDFEWEVVGQPVRVPDLT